MWCLLCDRFVNCVCLNWFDVWIICVNSNVVCCIIVGVGSGLVLIWVSKFLRLFVKVSVFKVILGLVIGLVN